MGATVPMGAQYDPPLFISRFAGILQLYIYGCFFAILTFIRFSRL
jgi:hypothetical protein